MIVIVALKAYGVKIHFAIRLVSGVQLFLSRKMIRRTERRKGRDVFPMRKIASYIHIHDSGLSDNLRLTTDTPTSILPPPPPPLSSE